MRLLAFVLVGIGCVTINGNAIAQDFGYVPPGFGGSFYGLNVGNGIGFGYGAGYQIPYQALNGSVKGTGRHRQLTSPRTMTSILLV